MKEAKPWYQSTSVIGSIVTLASMVLALSGVNVSEAQASQLADKLMLVGMGVGGVLSLVGRLKADQPIGPWRARVQQLPAGQYIGFSGCPTAAPGTGTPLAEGQLVGSPPPSQGGFARPAAACLLALLAALSLSLSACSFAPYGGSPPLPEKCRQPHASEAAPASGSATSTALAQAAGVLTALSNLPPAPADAAARAHIEGWQAWAGYLAPLVGTVANAALAGDL
jgi:hypothetical protein